MFRIIVTTIYTWIDDQDTDMEATMLFLNNNEFILIRYVVFIQCAMFLKHVDTWIVLNK